MGNVVRRVEFRKVRWPQRQRAEPFRLAEHGGGGSFAGCSLRAFPGLKTILVRFYSWKELITFGSGVLLYLSSRLRSG